MNTSAALQQPRFEQGTITVQNIYPSKGQGKSAHIKDSDGMLFGIWPDKLGLVQVGGTYEIEFSASTKNGTTYRDIKQLHMVEKPQPQPARSLSSAAAPAPQTEKPQNGGYYRPTAPQDSERMFCCSTLNAFIQTGRVECHREHLTIAINELRAAYAATFGADDH
jgi:hypothetical protein